jgi:hypothetical protein
MTDEKKEPNAERNPVWKEWVAGLREVAALYAVRMDDGDDAMLMLYHAHSIVHSALLHAMFDADLSVHDPAVEPIDKMCHTFGGCMWVQEYCVATLNRELGVELSTVRRVEDVLKRYTAVTGRPESQLKSASQAFFDAATEMCIAAHGRPGSRRCLAVVLFVAWTDMRACYRQMLERAPSMAAEVDALYQTVYEGEINQETAQPSEKEVEHGS